MVTSAAGSWPASLLHAAATQSEATGEFLQHTGNCQLMLEITWGSITVQHTGPSHCGIYMTQSLWNIQDSVTVEYT